LAVLLVGLLGCAATSGSVAPGQGEDIVYLRQQVSAQGTRIAALETRVSLPQQAAAAQPTVKPAPTPTVIPSVAGLVVDGNTKGAASAKVTITEYLDYL
jgi:protein-disulfide isomerase